LTWKELLANLQCEIQRAANIHGGIALLIVPFVIEIMLIDFRMEMAVVLAHAEKLGIDSDMVDERSLFLNGRPCQVIPATWFNNSIYPQCTAMTLYMPRTEFADFLLYVPHESDDVFVIPRGLLEYDTTWSEQTLTAYRNAWQLLQETSPKLFVRRFAHLSPPLRRVISALEVRNIPYKLVRSKKGNERTQGRIYRQRRLLVNRRRCAIFTPKYIERTTTYSPVVIFKTANDDWTEFMLYLLDEDFYVVPREQLPYTTTLTLSSSRIRDCKNNWDVLKA
jgi:hypothetical protein